MKIVVATPTGHIGSRIVQLLVQAGVRPTLLARDPNRLSPEVRAASDTRQGNLADAEFVRQATEGADALFWLIPSNYGSDKPVEEMLQLGQNAADAIRANGIARTILLSSAGAEKRGEGFIGALGKSEDLLNATGATILHLRPGYFYTNLFMDLESLRQGVLTTTLSPDKPMPWNDPRDIADYAAARLLSTEWSGQAVQPLSGPKLLSYTDVAATVREAVGRPIQAVQITEEDLRNGLLSAGLSAAATEAMVAMERGLHDWSSSAYNQDLASTLPTPLDGWCYANLRPALAG